MLGGRMSGCRRRDGFLRIVAQDTDLVVDVAGRAWMNAVVYTGVV